MQEGAESCSSNVAADCFLVTLVVFWRGLCRLHVPGFCVHTHTHTYAKVHKCVCVCVSERAAQRFLLSHSWGAMGCCTNFPKNHFTSTGSGVIICPCCNTTRTLWIENNTFTSNSLFGIRWERASSTWQVWSLWVVRTSCTRLCSVPLGWTDVNNEDGHMSNHDV